MVNSDTKISDELSKMLKEQREIEYLINFFIFGLFLVLVMYLYLI